MSILLSLWLASRRTRRGAEPPCPAMPVHQRQRHRHDAVLRAIDRRVRDLGDRSLTKGERIIWSTALAIAILTGDRDAPFSAPAKLPHWSAARIGFAAMELPDAADCVVALVKELAFRAALAPNDRQAESRSLVRLAMLRQRFRTISAGTDMPARFNAMIERLYP
ncbi:MAG: hypothetical protein ACREB7_07275 [Sphingopyxis sp.]|uniref:hypothetical protein n=1 Tax=Sphingopyxis sp. TaxID=1908224 RepID=UPI003D6D5900